MRRYRFENDFAAWLIMACAVGLIPCGIADRSIQTVCFFMAALLMLCTVNRFTGWPF